MTQPQGTRHMTQPQGARHMKCDKHALPGKKPTLEKVKGNNRITALLFYR